MSMELRNGVITPVNSWRLKMDNVKLKQYVVDYFRANDL